MADNRNYATDYATFGSFTCSVWLLYICPIPKAGLDNDSKYPFFSGHFDVAFPPFLLSRKRRLLLIRRFALLSGVFG